MNRKQKPFRVGQCYGAVLGFLKCSVENPAMIGVMTDAKLALSKSSEWTEALGCTRSPSQVLAKMIDGKHPKGQFFTLNTGCFGLKIKMERSILS